MQLRFERSSTPFPGISVKPQTVDLLRGLELLKYLFPPISPTPGRPSLDLLLNLIVTSRTPDDHRAIARFFKNSPLRYYDFKSLIEGIIDVASLPPRVKSPDREEVQKAVEKWGEEGIKYWREYEDEMRKKTLDPPGDPEDDD